MYKLIAVDLDGTILNTYGEISDYTKRILNETMQKGIEVVITSGRTVDSIKGIASEINSKKYIIAGNGSVVFDIHNNDIIYEKYISKFKALNLINLCEKNSISYSVYTNKTIVANSLKYNILYYYKSNIQKNSDKKTSITIVDNIYDYVKNMQDEKVMKIFICDKNKCVFNSILRKLNNLEDVEVLDISHMSRKIITNGTEEIPIEYFYTEITEKNVDKWYALKFLIDKLNISKNDVISIGDNVNDIKMIKNAGLGISMKNAISSKVLDVADFVTDVDNDHDGAAKAIEKFIL